MNICAQSHSHGDKRNISLTRLRSGYFSGRRGYSCNFRLPPSNLLPSMVVPKAVNGQNMQPIGYVPVMLQLNDKQYQEELHLFPGVRGAIISWKAARELGILPTHYPMPIQVTVWPYRRLK